MCHSFYSRFSGNTIGNKVGNIPAAKCALRRFCPPQKALLPKNGFIRSGLLLYALFSAV